MKYTTLGKTNLKISVVGLGGIPIQKTDVSGVKSVLAACVEMGINYIDTARAYTVSEEYLGAALEGRREKFIIATKSMARDYESMKADIEKSLKNLRTDHIDLYQIHNIRNEDEFALCFGENGAYKALAEAKEAGKIGHIGATAHAPEAFERLITEFEDKIETLMFPYNIVENQGVSLMAKCTEKNIGFIAMKPLAGGNLDDATLALRYILQNPDCTVVIPGMGDAREVYQNAEASELGALNEEEMLLCEKIRRELGQNFCRRCGYCAPCTKGIDIPSNFLIANYLRRYGLSDWAKARYATLKVNASACVECGICETRCPYHLPIRSMLKQVTKDMGEA
ncbi:MAG: aldo/keto reductase [Ruminococcaceae bacterium]|nr:aldo/keto reductase [Oscillospiraceae bacterium]